MSSNHYGVCTDCGKELPTKSDARTHMSETNPGTLGTSSHRISVLNPPREDVIRGRIVAAIEDAITEAMDDIDRFTRPGYDYTDAEIRAALAGFPDFADAWDEYTREVSA